MPSQNAVAVGGSRGLGRGAVEALAARGFDIAVVGRDERALGSLAAEVRGVRPVVGDATDETLAQRLLAERKPDLLLLTAGAPPALGPFHELSWEQFETNWRVDAKLAFVWLRAALRQPLPPGAHIIVVSSGAAVAGSPVSGGYAAAKRAQWFLAQYAATEIERAKLAIRVHCVLPQLNPSTDLGRAGVAAYARRAGLSDDEFAKRLAPFVTPAVFGAAIAELAADPGRFAELAYRLSGAGLAPLPAS